MSDHIYDKMQDRLREVTANAQLGWPLADAITLLLLEVAQEARLDELARMQKRVDQMASERDTHMHAATYHTSGVQSLQKQIAEQKARIEELETQLHTECGARFSAEALVVSHEGHIARLEQRIAGLVTGGAKVRDQLAYHLGRNSRLSAGYKRLRKAAERVLMELDTAVYAGLDELQKEVDDRSAFIDEPQVHWNQKKAGE